MWRALGGLWLIAGAFGLFVGVAHGEDSVPPDPLGSGQLGPFVLGMSYAQFEDACRARRGTTRERLDLPWPDPLFVCRLPDGHYSVSFRDGVMWYIDLRFDGMMTQSYHDALQYRFSLLHGPPRRWDGRHWIWLSTEPPRRLEMMFIRGPLGLLTVTVRDVR